MINNNENGLEEENKKYPFHIDCYTDEENMW